ncbi:hypothetical protein HXX76_003174 [Chlamydomonas incerta]|uniref:Peptidase S54 rhomboid domain-containing protein n=1 Tax=Chlamydomonas incerta TaxID=51695 RepID=A0A835W8I9_CHLIN|nr:hypothetical protein HXX76_003174 [Chlamydomonas incerta]|eukprot:KAG2441553.1 hypothetical protein HXX76_003174 [Chlamydomonas incerta]
MYGGGGAGRALPSPSDWSSRGWLGRRLCKRARLQLQRALRGGGNARLRAGLGAGVLTASAAGVAAASPPPEGSGAPPPRPMAWSDFGHPRRRTTDVFLCLNAAVFVLNWLSRDVLLIWGAKVNALIAAGQWWRLVTPLFLHSNLFHLAINMHALHTLGPQVEVVSGSRRTAAIYMASGLVASVASFLFCPLPSLGASGAMFGLGAALGMFYWRHADILGPASDTGLRSLGLTAAINIAYSLVNKRIDNWGHFGGLVGGALVSYLLGPAFHIVTTPGGLRGVQDNPPLPWLAFKAPTIVGGSPVLRRLSRGPADAAAAGPGLGPGGSSSPSSSSSAVAEPEPAPRRRVSAPPFLRGRGPPVSSLDAGLDTGGGRGGSGGGGGGSGRGPRPGSGDAEAGGGSLLGPSSSSAAPSG